MGEYRHWSPAHARSTGRGGSTCNSSRQALQEKSGRQSWQEARAHGLSTAPTCIIFIKGLNGVPGLNGFLRPGAARVFRGFGKDFNYLSMSLASIIYRNKAYEIAALRL